MCVLVSYNRTHKRVTFSTSKAEYVALGDAVKELLFLRQVWRFMIPGKGKPCFPVFEDNQGALELSKNPVSNSNSKHIDVHHHFLRGLVRQGDIIVSHVPSEYQCADILTKILAFDLFAIHRRFLMNLGDDYGVVVIWWISKLTYVCLHEFSNVGTAGGCTNSSTKKGKKRIRGAVTKHLSDLLVSGD